MRVAVLVGSLSGGGQSTVQTTLARALARQGRTVDLLFFRTPGPAPPALDPGVRLVDLRRSPPRDAAPAGALSRPDGHLGGGGGGAFVRSLGVLLRQLSTSRLPFVRPYPDASRLWLWRSLRALTEYLRESSPVALYAAGDSANLLALTARRNAGVPTRVVAGLCVVPGPRRRPERTGAWRGWLSERPVLRALPQADGIVAISRGVAAHWSRAARIPRSRITTIYTPVVDSDLPRLAEAVPDHPFFEPTGPPVILGVGRLAQQKDFATLLRAFAAVRSRQPARLLILGDGPERGRLERLAESLGLESEVSFPGYVRNPYPFMARAGLLASASLWEGLGMVLIMALACGCPVVSTDCPAGPAEVLEGGRYGRLTPVGDPAALAEAILATLREPPARAPLRARGRWFTVERAVREYARFLPDSPAS